MNNSLRVLVVDDESRFRDNITKILGGCGMQARQAEDGQHAVDMTLEQPFDVVLLDMKMPGLSGLETLGLMRANGLSAEVIVLTGNASVSGALDMMELGAFDYLLKPVDVTALINKVKLAGEKKLMRDSRFNKSDPTNDPA